MSNYEVGLKIIDELLPLALESKTFQIAQHLMRTRKLFTFIHQTTNAKLDIPTSIRTGITQFAEGNQVGLNVEWMKVHTADLEKLFGEIDVFCLQNTIPIDASSSIADFMAEMKYSLATIQADEMRVNVDLKAEKFAEAQQYLFHIQDQVYLDLIDQTAPDLDGLIAQWRDLQSDTLS